MIPRYLYKILDAPPPDPLPAKLPATQLDSDDGFIHLSTAQQTPITAALFFGHVEKLWLLKLDRTALGGRIEWTTDPHAQVPNGCAHLHESQGGLGHTNVVEVVLVERQIGHDWGKVGAMMALEG